MAGSYLYEPVFHKMREISWLGEELLAAQKGICYLELVIRKCNISYLFNMFLYFIDSSGHLLIV